MPLNQKKALLRVWATKWQAAWLARQPAGQAEGHSKVRQQRKFAAYLAGCELKANKVSVAGKETDSVVMRAKGTS